MQVEIKFGYGPMFSLDICLSNREKTQTFSLTFIGMHILNWYFICRLLTKEKRNQITPPQKKKKHQKIKFKFSFGLVNSERVMSLEIRNKKGKVIVSAMYLWNDAYVKFEVRLNKVNIF